MKALLISIGLAVVLASSLSAQSKKPAAALDYLGQTPPGATPVVFAPGIVSTEDNEHSAPSFSPGGDEVFWFANRKPGPDNDKWLALSKTMRRENGRWSEPHPSPFDGMVTFLPDGQRVHFSVRSDLWIAEKQGDNWGEPTCLGIISRFPELKSIPMASASRTGTLYFLANKADSPNEWGLYTTRSHPNSSPLSARRCVWNRGPECSTSAPVRGRCCAPGHAITRGALFAAYLLSARRSGRGDHIAPYRRPSCLPSGPAPDGAYTMEARMPEPRYLRVSVARWDIDLDSPQAELIFRQIETDGVAVFRAQPGFVRYRLMRADNTTTVAVAEWESEQLGLAGAEHYRAWMLSVGIMDRITLDTRAGEIVASS